MCSSATVPLGSNLTSVSDRAIPILISSEQPWIAMAMLFTTGIPPGSELKSITSLENIRSGLSQPRGYSELDEPP